MQRFRIEYATQRCVSAALVNDVPVHRSPGSGALDLSVPVGAWLTQGANSFGVRIEGAVPGALVDPRGEVSASLAAHEFGRIQETQRILSVVAIGPEEDRIKGSTPPGAVDGAVAGAVALRESSTLVEAIRPVRIDAPIPRWRWLDSPAMVDTPALRASLLEEYRRIHALMLARERRGWDTLLAERTREYREALNAGADDVPDDYGIPEMFDGSVTLDPLEADDADFFLYGHGRLAEWVRWDGEPLISYSNGESEFFFRFIFRREQDRWIVTR